MTEDIRDLDYGDNKQYVAAIDFGTSGSGVVWGVANVAPGEEVKFNIAHRPDNSNYAKSPTVMLVRKTLLSRLNNIRDSELNIIFNETWNDNCNVCIGDRAYQQYFRFEHARRQNGGAAGEWVLFENFKMALYSSNENRYGRQQEIRGADGMAYDLQGIITLYLQCLKLTTFAHIRKNGIEFENMEQSIRWGITIPTIWGSEEKGIMERAVEKALGSDEIIFLLEPEGAARSFELNPNLKQLLKPGTTFMVVDCGGGTIDIVVHRIRPNLSFEEVVKERGNAMGGWEIDKCFFRLMAEKIAHDMGEFRDFQMDKAYEKLIEQFYMDDPSGKYHLDKAWEKNKRNKPEEGIMGFNVPQGYQIWFKRHYPKAAEKMIDDFGLVLDFTADEIQHAFQPVIAQISDLLIKTYDEMRGRQIKLDYIFGAGGLIALPSLQKCIQASTKTSNFTKVKNDTFDVEKHCLFASNMDIEQMCAGGSIVMGAAHILVRKGDIARIAKRYYYLRIGNIYNINSIELIKNQLIQQFKHYYQDVEAPEYIRSEMLKELERSFKRDFSSSLIENQEGHFEITILQPVVFKNLSITNFNNLYFPMYDNQTSITFQFYSSEHIHLFPKAGIEDLVKEECEGSNSFSIEPHHRERGYRLTVDFNETQQNYFVIKAFDQDGHERMSNRIKPALKLGH